MDFINWCNANQGFLSFALSLFTILLSIIAIIISIINFRVQYKKNLSVDSYFLLDDSNKLVVYIVNNGYIPLGIERVSLSYKNVFLCYKAKYNRDKKRLMPTESLTVEYIIDKKYIDILSDEKQNKLFIIKVKDTYGKEYTCEKIYPAV